MKLKTDFIKRHVAFVMALLFMSISVVTLFLPSAAYADDDNAEEITWASKPDELYADAACLIDADTGEVLYSKNANEERYPASITKICTALVILENFDLDDTLTFEGEALDPLPEGYVSIQPSAGEKMKVRDCMYALLMQSANDAGSGLAVYAAGTIAGFADMMNERAKEAGAKHTHFTNPSGIAEEDHYTTAYDMCMIMRQCVQYDDFITIASDKTHKIPKTNKHAARYLKSHVSPLLESSPYYDERVICGKTGFTTPSMRTMVTCAEVDGRRLICCVMKCDTDAQRCKDTKALYDYGFSYNTVSVTDKLWDSFVLNTDQDALRSLINNRKFTRSIVSCDGVRLPEGATLNDLDVQITEVAKEESGTDDIAKGAITVTLQFSHDGDDFGTAVLRYTPESLLQSFVDKTTNKSSLNVLIKCFYALIGVGILVVLGLIVLFVYKGRKKAVTAAENPEAAGTAALTSAEEEEAAVDAMPDSVINKEESIEEQEAEKAEEAADQEENKAEEAEAAEQKADNAEEANAAEPEADNAEEPNDAEPEAYNAEEANAAEPETDNAEEANAAEPEAYNAEEANTAEPETDNADEAAGNASEPEPDDSVSSEE